MGGIAVTRSLESVKGWVLPPHQAIVEAGAIRMFALAIGDERRVCHDARESSRQGYRGIVAPPTFLFVLDQQRPAKYDVINAIGVGVEQILHGEQGFRFYDCICAGDPLDFSSHISDAYAKERAGLEFIVRSTQVHRAGALVAQLRNITVIRLGHGD